MMSVIAIGIGYCGGLLQTRRVSVWTLPAAAVLGGCWGALGVVLAAAPPLVWVACSLLTGYTLGLSGGGWCERDD